MERERDAHSHKTYKKLFTWIDDNSHRVWGVYLHLNVCVCVSWCITCASSPKMTNNGAGAGLNQSSSTALSMCHCFNSMTKIRHAHAHVCRNDFTSEIWSVNKSGVFEVLYSPNNIQQTTITISTNYATRAKQQQQQQSKYA